jgi:5-methylthioadenosine/S-adenosylhomocysteine deaminase
MDDAGTVIDDGILYADEGSLTAVLPATAVPPTGFEEVRVVQTGCTLFPGLIELHNHLPYDVLQLWQVPKSFTNRDQWSSPSTADYHRLISGPMGVLGRDPDSVAAIVRYVEVRCLLGGTTTSQGVALASDPGIVTHFRGLVRNVESTADSALPPAATHIADVDASDAERFLARISGDQKLLLHLAEGIDHAAHDHFQALHLSRGRWAITDNLIGIHCAALTKRDFGALASHGGSMVWSPLSNLLLYGRTARVGAALSEGVPVALGSDWAPSGSKNLLGELKVAKIAAPQAGATLSDEQLVAMATKTPARMLGWADQLGTLECAKRADVIGIHGVQGDPYAALLAAGETGIELVMINGVPRAATPDLMSELGLDGETVSVGSGTRIVNLTQHDADPTVEHISIAEAVSRLRSALQHLPDASVRSASAELSRGRSLLAIAGVVDNQMSPRPHLPYRGHLTGPNLPGSTAAPSQPHPLPALTLDPLTAIDNPAYYQALDSEPNIAASIRHEIATASAQ